MINNNQNTNAFLIHICAFAGFIFPFGHIITPLIAWQTLKDRSPFLDQHGKEAINFNVSYTLYAFLLMLCCIPITFGFLSSEYSNFSDFKTIASLIGFGSITGIIYLTGIALVVIAAKKAKEGENYNYPFTIKFLK